MAQREHVYQLLSVQDLECDLYVVVQTVQPQHWLEMQLMVGRAVQSADVQQQTALIKWYLMHGIREDPDLKLKRNILNTCAAADYSERPEVERQFRKELDAALGQYMLEQMRLNIMLIEQDLLKLRHKQAATSDVAGKTA
eukprot:1989-Heterococcus_DN1.PRE.1